MVRGRTAAVAAGGPGISGFPGVTKAPTIRTQRVAPLPIKGAEARIGRQTNRSLLSHLFHAKGTTRTHRGRSDPNQSRRRPPRRSRGSGPLTRRYLPAFIASVAAPDPSPWPCPRAMREDASGSRDVLVVSFPTLLEVLTDPPGDQRRGTPCRPTLCVSPPDPSAAARDRAEEPCSPKRRQRPRSRLATRPSPPPAPPRSISAVGTDARPHSGRRPGAVASAVARIGPPQLPPAHAEPTATPVPQPWASVDAAATTPRGGPPRALRPRSTPRPQGPPAAQAVRGRAGASGGPPEPLGPVDRPGARRNASLLPTAR
jgi:hypothetical protein